LRKLKFGDLALSRFLKATAGISEITPQTLHGLAAGKSGEDCGKKKNGQFFHDLFVLGFVSLLKHLRLSSPK
jgi:hypothetical protein